MGILLTFRHVPVVLEQYVSESTTSELQLATRSKKQPYKWRSICHAQNRSMALEWFKHLVC